MLFSIVVPIYNVGNYLEDCLSSILNQKYDDFECILVDDGSTDNSSQICLSYCEKDERFKFSHKENGGLVSARQYGASLAKGDYVVCVDGDDWIHQDYLLEFANIIEKLHPDILCCGAIWYYSQDKQIKRNFALAEGYYDRDKIKQSIFPLLIHNEKGNYFPPSLWSKAFKRELYISKQLEVNPIIKIGEDMACTYPCVCNATSIYCIKECFYYYRQNNQSMTHRKVFECFGPKCIGEHLENHVADIAIDFTAQIDRIVVHLLFNCCVSQFYSHKKYRNICKELCEIINEPYYDNAIRRCKYSIGYIQGCLALFAMKHRCYFLMKIYSMCK